MTAEIQDDLQDDLYEAFFDKRVDDDLLVGVTSTGIFCRTGCPGKRPKRENCEFVNGAEAALAAGFRACKRCHAAPLDKGSDDPALMRRLITLVEDAEDGRVDEAMLRAEKIDPSTARRIFKARLGLSFSKYARLRRLGRAAQAISQGASVIEAQLEAGFDSPSGFRAAFAKTFGVAPGKSIGDAAPDPLFIDWIETPMGRMVTVSDRTHLYLIEFTDRVRLPRQFERLRRTHKRAILPGQSEAGQKAAHEIQAYFEGSLQTFSVPMITSGTDFQDGVWDALQTIPYGQTWSYADLAKRIGNEKAVRAVASANGANGLAIIIPCHRVIGSDGGLGGYAGGLGRKQELLDLEARHAGLRLV